MKLRKYNVQVVGGDSAVIGGQLSPQCAVPRTHTLASIMRRAGRRHGARTGGMMALPSFRVK